MTISDSIASTLVGNSDVSLPPTGGRGHTYVTPSHFAERFGSACLVSRLLLFPCLQRLLDVQALAHSTPLVLLFDLILRSTALEGDRLYLLLPGVSYCTLRQSPTGSWAVLLRFFAGLQ